MAAKQAVNDLHLGRIVRRLRAETLGSPKGLSDANVFGRRPLRSRRSYAGLTHATSPYTVGPRHDASTSRGNSGSWPPSLVSHQLWFSLTGRESTSPSENGAARMDRAGTRMFLNSCRPREAAPLLLAASVSRTFAVGSLESLPKSRPSWGEESLRRSDCLKDLATVTKQTAVSVCFMTANAVA